MAVRGSFISSGTPKGSKNDGFINKEIAWLHSMTCTALSFPSLFLFRLCRIHFLRALYVRNVYKNVWARNAALLSLILQLLRLCCKSFQCNRASVLACVANRMLLSYTFQMLPYDRSRLARKQTKCLCPACFGKVWHCWWLASLSHGYLNFKCWKGSSICLGVVLYNCDVITHIAYIPMLKLGLSPLLTWAWTAWLYLNLTRQDARSRNPRKVNILYIKQNSLCAWLIFWVFHLGAN